MAIKYTAIVNGVEYGEYVDDIPQYCDIMNSVGYDEQTVMMAIHDALVTIEISQMGNNKLRMGINWEAGEILPFFYSSAIAVR